MVEVKHNHELDYVCPQCGSDPNGEDSHQVTNHTWPPGPRPYCPACKAGVALTMVRKIHKDPSEPFVPEIDLFPWIAWCSICPWKTNTGAWRDAYDLAFYHSIGGNHIDPAIDISAVAIPAVVLQMEALGESDTDGDTDNVSGNSSNGIPTGGPVREGPLDEDYDPCQDPYYDGSGSYY